MMNQFGLPASGLADALVAAVGADSTRVTRHHLDMAKSALVRQWGAQADGSTVAQGERRNGG